MFFFGNITFANTEVAKKERLIYFSIFEAKANHVFQFSYLQFVNLDFKADGFFIALYHSSSVYTPLSMDHLIFQGNRRGYMQLDSTVSDEQLRKVIVITESTWHSHFVESSPLVRTIGNVQLLLSDSFFIENYSFREGTAIYVDQSLALIKNTTFLNNYA